MAQRECLGRRFEAACRGPPKMANGQEMEGRERRHRIPMHRGFSPSRKLRRLGTRGRGYLTRFIIRFREPTYKIKMRLRLDCCRPGDAASEIAERATPVYGHGEQRVAGAGGSS